MLFSYTHLDEYQMITYLMSDWTSSGASACYQEDRQRHTFACVTHNILPPLPSPYRLDASLSRLRCLSWSSNGNFLIALLACMLLKETHTSAFFKPAHLKYVGTMLLIPAIALDRRNIFGKQYICFWLWSSCGCNPLLRPCSQRLPPNTRHHYPAVLAEMQIAKSQQIFPQMCTNLFLNVHRGVPIHLTRAKLQLFKEKSLRLFCQTSHRTFEFTKDFTILPKPISFACLLI